jgi:hypothetical protein
MKASGAIVIGVVLLGVFLSGGLTPVQAADYLGEFCWQGGGGGTARLAVTHMGGGHFLLNGKLIGIVTEPAVGSAEVLGNNVYITLTTTGSDVIDTWASFGRVVLDLATLNGTVEVLGVDHSKISPDPNNASAFYDGLKTLTFVACP